MNFHEEKAKEIFGKEQPTAEEVRMAKAINFGQLYGSVAEINNSVTVEEKFNYILNFDENKLFNTKLDDENTDKVKARKSIRKAKEAYKERLEDVEKACDVARAFEFCGIRYTNTPHQGLEVCIRNVLRYSEYLHLLDYTYNELKKVEE